jgi:tetratricopeptide (TPR) repeat protein
LAANKRKILEAARKHAQKGAKEKALKEFGKLLKLDPRDSKVRLEMGDTHRRWGQVDEAIEAYSSVADQFMQEGFDARAVAVFKQIQNLQPNTFSYYEPLAELYQRMGLTAEAIGCLESAAESYREAGQKQEALGLLRKMAAIDPSNTNSRIKVADLLQQEGMEEEAVSEYDAVVAELELQGDTETAAKLFERILEIQPDRIETLVIYARNLIDRGSAQRAESLAKRALELDNSPENYELLADVYRMDQREEELIALYRELAEVYRERGDEERTREILQRYVPLDEIGSTDTPNGYIDENEDLDEGEDLLDELSIGDETTLLDGDLLSDPSLLVSDDDSGFGTLSQDDDLNEFSSSALDLDSDSNDMTCLMPDEPSGGSSPVGSEDGGAEIDVNQLLAEASVYLRYGKRSQAIANLESILEHDSDHRLALEKLGEALAEGDDAAKAVEMWSRAAKLAAEAEEADAAEVLRSRIATLDPAAAAALDLAIAPEPEPEPEPELETDPDLDLELDPELDSDLESELESDLESEPESELESDPDLELDPEFDPEPELESEPEPESDTGERLIADDLIDEASDDLSIPDDLAAAPSEKGSAELDGEDLPELDLAEVSITDLEIEIDIDDASFAQDPPDEEPPTETDAELAADAPAPIADADMDELSGDEPSSASEAAESGEADVDDESTESEAQTVAGAGGDDVSPEQIAEDLEEADFYMEQGLLDEAEAVYSRVLSIVPNHPHAMVRLGELASQRGDAPASVESAADPAEEIGDSADSVAEEPAASDIGADLADWQEDEPEDEAQETDEQPGANESGAPMSDGPIDFTASDVEWVDATDALDGEEEGSADEKSAASESDLVADLGLEESTNSGLGSEVDGGVSASAGEQDETGELPEISVEPDELSVEPDEVSVESDELSAEPDDVSVEPDGLSAEPDEVSVDPDEVSVDPDELSVESDDVSVEPDESETPESVEALESPVEVPSEAPDGEGEPAEGGDNFGFDLAAELSQSFDQDPGSSGSGTTGAGGRGDTSEDGFASVFAEFKKGVSETLTEGDHQAHYDLGIAYREMGLLNDAVTEFQMAMDAPERRVGCLHLMGMCAHDMGESEQAIGHFTEALASRDISEETLLALKLDLGKSHEAVGDIASARHAYEEIQAIDPDFADVAARLDELEKSEDVDPQADGSPDTEEYETFDEFLGNLDEPDADEPDADEPEADEPEAAAGSTGDTEEVPVWETFDDVVAEIDAADDADSASGVPEAEASAESGTDTEDPEPAEPAVETEKTPKRRKKKISFV